MTEMIFVTVGSYKFDQLIRTIDEAVRRGHLPPDIEMQIGNGEYEPKSCAYFRSAPSLAPYYSRASVVIAHGGTGTTLEVIRCGLPLISIANTSLADNHQHEFLEEMESLGALHYCRRLVDLPGTIVEFKQNLREDSTNRSFLRSVTDCLELFQPKTSLRMNLATKLMAPIRFLLSAGLKQPVNSKRQVQSNKSSID